MVYWYFSHFYLFIYLFTFKSCAKKKKENSTNEYKVNLAMGSWTNLINLEY